MITFRSLKPLGRLALAAAIGTAALAVFCALRVYLMSLPWLDLYGSNATVEFGVSARDDSGKVWRWATYQRRGLVECNSKPVDAAQAHVWMMSTPYGWERGTPPSWAVCVEEKTVRGHEVVDVVDSGYGWPMPCVQSRLVRLRDTTGKPAMRQLIGAKPNEELIVPHVEIGVFSAALTPENARMGYGEIWPTRVLWMGLMVNVAVWTLGAFALLSVPSTYRFIRARHRRLKGRCVHCGYSLAGMTVSAPCPECGRTASTRP
jgi:hypothetical protein